jgi:hypothetical protein
VSLDCKLFSTFLCVRSAAILVNNGQRGLSLEKGSQNPKPRPKINLTDSTRLRKILCGDTPDALLTDPSTELVSISGPHPQQVMRLSRTLLWHHMDTRQALTRARDVTTIGTGKLPKNDNNNVNNNNDPVEEAPSTTEAVSRPGRTLKKSR